MAHLIGILFGLAIVFAISVGITSIFWLAYSWAMPQLWPAGPENLVEPGFWLFYVAVVLLSWFGRLVFPRAKEARK